MRKEGKCSRSKKKRKATKMRKKEKKLQQRNGFVPEWKLYLEN